MDNAIKQCADCPVTYEIEYRPYKLHTSLKDDQIFERRAWYESRLGAEKVASIERMIGTRAKQVGLDIKLFDGVISQTTLAHRLMLKAWNMGGQKLQLPLLEELFKEYFVEGNNTGDPQVLAKAASTAGVMSESETIRFLESEEYSDEVERMMLDVRRKGVTGVPFVVIDGRWAVSGGQSAETYVQILKKIGKSCSPPKVDAAPDCTGSP